MEKNDAPDIYYIMYKNIIVFDHFNNTMQLITLGEEAELDALMKAINKANVKPYDFHPVGETASTLTDEEHKANIRRCIQHCLRGDVFQIVVSRRFVQKYEGDDFKLYRALRSINPSPYLSTSTLAVSASSAHRPRPTIALSVTRLSSTQ